MFARDDDVHIVTALDAVVKAGEQAVGIGRQIHAHDVGLLVGDVVEEAGVLMREAVVVLLPDVGGEDIVEGGDIVAPGELIAHLEPLGVLGKHRVDNADEGLVAVKEAVAARQQVTFEEALAEVLGEHGVHHAAVGVKVLVDAIDLLVEAAARDVKHGLQTVGRRLVGREDAEVARLHVELHHIADIGAKDVHVLRLDLAGGGDIDRVVAEVGRAQVAQEKTAVGVRVCAHAVLALGREGRDQLDRRTVLVEELFGLVAIVRAAAGACFHPRPWRWAPDGHASCLRSRCRRPPSDRSSPSGCAARASASGDGSPCRFRARCAGCA